MNISLTKTGLAALGLMAILSTGCQKQVVTQYEIEDVELYSSASEKKNLKSDEQFISILYTDIFGKSITNGEMQTMNEAYTSIGDKSLIIDILIKSLLTDSSADIPGDSEMRANPSEFVKTTYKRFLVRKPTKQEEWFLVNQINQNKDLKTVDIYYALLTGDEYRYY